MKLELSRRTVAGVALFFAASLVLLLLMFVRLGTISLPGTHVRSVRVTFADAQGLPVQADVLVHGVKVGSVSNVSSSLAGSTVVTLTLGSGAPILHPGASADVGFKTPLGEPFIDLDPGSGAGRLSGPLQARSTVELDDALAFLDRGGRANLRASLLGLGRGLASPSADGELGGTLSALATTTNQLGALLSELHSQRGALTGIVSGGRRVLDVLAGRAGELRALTADADTALSAIGSQRSALGATLGRLPGLEALGSRTLQAARPLISTATPLVGRISSAAPALTRALDAVPSSTSALDEVLGQAGSIRQTALPALSLLRALAAPGSTATSLLGPVLADIVPMAQYLGPRGRTIAAWFANTADLGNHGDAKGDWARFFVMFDPSTLLGLRPGAPPGNSYTAPGDAAHNSAFAAGSYPRLEPYSPALASGK